MPCGICPAPGSTRGRDGRTIDHTGAKTGVAKLCPCVGPSGTRRCVGAPCAGCGTVPYEAVTRWLRPPKARVGVEAIGKDAAAIRLGNPRPESRTETAISAALPRLDLVRAGDRVQRRAGE